MNDIVFSIALDGPAGAGKSTVARAIADKLLILHLDTGAMYRSVALYAIEHNISICNADAVENMLKDVEIAVTYENGIQKTFVNGIDVMDKIRTSEVSKGASDIAVVPAVRVKLVEIQRELASKHSLILDGRDIGSYVLPNAKYKFYITADAKERARRRLFEMQAKGIDKAKTLDEMTAEIQSRDNTDSTRDFAPLLCPKDAVVINTTHMSVEQVVDKVLLCINEGRK